MAIIMAQKWEFLKKAYISPEVELKPNDSELLTSTPKWHCIGWS